MSDILKAIGEENRSLVARPIDVLLLQEQSRSAGLPTTQAIVNLLNGIYAGQGITYARGTLIGDGDSTQTIVYKTQTVFLYSIANGGEIAFSSATQPRDTLRYKLKPVGYDDSAAFYIYNSHYKASTGSTNAAVRLDEANAIRANSDALGNGIHAIYVGDHNFYDYDTTEPAWKALTDPGNGQAVDPIYKIGTWSSHAEFAAVHTQSPTTFKRDLENFGGQAVGGMDDRFDFQLSTAEVAGVLVNGQYTGGDGVSYIANTYRAFGNNGTTYNMDIDNVANTYPFDLVQFDATHTRQQLLTKLASVTDHLPVVVDYRIPAKMGVQVASIPSFVSIGENVPITVSVENIAPVTFSQFADELDYTINLTGSLKGSSFTGNTFTDIDPAAGGGHTNDVSLITSTPGLKTGSIIVTATSDQASSPLFTLPVNFTVLAADFNMDRHVDAADLQRWSTNFGISSGATNNLGDADLDGDVDGADYAVWQREFGAGSPAFAAGAAVPEPTTAAMILPLLATFAGFSAKRRRRRS